MLPALRALRRSFAEGGGGGGGVLMLFSMVVEHLDRVSARGDGAWVCWIKASAFCGGAAGGGWGKRGGLQTVNVTVTAESATVKTPVALGAPGDQDGRPGIVVDAVSGPCVVTNTVPVSMRSSKCGGGGHHSSHRTGSASLGRRGGRLCVFGALGRAAGETLQAE